MFGRLRYFLKSRTAAEYCRTVAEYCRMAMITVVEFKEIYRKYLRSDKQC